jgi:serine/threonine-protein kinase
VLRALAAAHAAGLVHRDVKPENVLLTGNDFAYLVDFGIAHIGGDSGLTSAGAAIGSCAYMAPERFTGGRVGPAADIYSLACLLYECLTGRAPFEAGDLRELMGAHMFSPPPRPSIMRRGISRAFDDVIARGMAKEPADRYQSAGDLANAAKAAAATESAPLAPVTPAPPPPQTRQFTSYPYAPLPPPPPAPARKSRFGPTQVALLVATVAMFTAAVVLAAVLVFGDRSDRGSTAQTPLAEPTLSTTPSTTTETTAPSTSDESTTTTTTTSTSATPIRGVSGTDDKGFVGHTARCDAGGSPAALIRTANSLAAVCETAPGKYYYRGERLRDGANLQLSNAMPVGGGFDVVNPADGARYQIRPDMLTIMSNGGVDSAEPALEFGTR